MTHVIFRKFRDGDVIALFPYEPHNRFDVDSINSYMHVGQHGEAHYTHIMKVTKQCKDNEHQELFNELLEQGYEDLNIIEKRNRKTAVKNLKDNFDY